MSPTLIPCPHCGGDIESDAEVCHHCGSSDDDGWGEPDLGLGDDEFDYDEFVRDEFSGSRFDTKLSPFWWWITAGLLALVAGGVALSIASIL